MNYPFIPEPRIERAALELLDGYGRRFGFIENPPVPVEEILEAFLSVDLEFDDLAAKYRLPDALGATFLAENRVVIDQFLDPSENPRMSGRYRFTLGHEIGHLKLHAPRREQTANLFGALSEPEAPAVILCRGSLKPPEEWQADCFSSHLLMPKDMVVAAWLEETGGTSPHDAIEEAASLTVSSEYAVRGWKPAVQIARQMAARFDVSGESMQIRLESMGLLLIKPRAPGLF